MIEQDYTVKIFFHEVTVKVVGYNEAIKGRTQGDPDDCEEGCAAQVEWEPNTGNELLDFFISEITCEVELDCIQRQLLTQAEQ